MSNEPKEKKKSKGFLYVIEAKGFADWYERDFFETREEAEEALEKLRKKHSGYAYSFIFKIKEKEEDK